jgi:hypothetical protein
MSRLSGATPAHAESAAYGLAGLAVSARLASRDLIMWERAGQDRPFGISHMPGGSLHALVRRRARRHRRAPGCAARLRFAGVVMVATFLVLTAIGMLSYVFMRTLAP